MARLSGAPLEEALAQEVRRFLALRAARNEGEIRDELLLSSPELGLDSIAVLDLLLYCERRFDVALDASLFDGGPMTVGGLVGRIREAYAARP